MGSGLAVSFLISQIVSVLLSIDMMTIANLTNVDLAEGGDLKSFGPFSV